ncbi:MAG: hypothetical protein LIO62_08410, partial [Clostridiales bacterium]|nr:hypothetical protein [Clostridiales bacterium]
AFVMVISTLTVLNVSSVFAEETTNVAELYFASDDATSATNTNSDIITSHTFDTQTRTSTGGSVSFDLYNGTTITTCKGGKTNGSFSVSVTIKGTGSITVDYLNHNGNSNSIGVALYASDGSTLLYSADTTTKNASTTDDYATVTWSNLKAGDYIIKRTGSEGYCPYIRVIDVVDPDAMADYTISGTASFADGLTVPESFTLTVGSKDYTAVVGDKDEATGYYSWTVTENASAAPFAADDTVSASYTGYSCETNEVLTAGSDDYTFTVASTLVFTEKTLSTITESMVIDATDISGDQGDSLTGVLGNYLEASASGVSKYVSSSSAAIQIGTTSSYAKYVQFVTDASYNVTVSFSSNGSSNSTAAAILDVEGDTVSAVGTSDTVTGTTAEDYSCIVGAGTHRISVTNNAAKGIRIYSITFEKVISSDLTLTASNQLNGDDSSKYFICSLANTTTTSRIRLTTNDSISFYVAEGATVTVNAASANSTHTDSRYIYLKNSSGTTVGTETFANNATQPVADYELATDLAAGTYTLTATGLDIPYIAITFSSSAPVYDASTSTITGTDGTIYYIVAVTADEQSGSSSYKLVDNNNAENYVTGDEVYDGVSVDGKEFDAVNDLGSEAYVVAFIINNTTAGDIDTSELSGRYSMEYTAITASEAE